MEELALVVEYDPLWPGRFDREKDCLDRACSGCGMSGFTVHHVGSTSVPGLAAKPVIDICLEVDPYPPTPALDQALAGLGYVGLGEAGVPGRHFYKKGTPRLFHLHACPAGGQVARSQLAFRSLLRTRPDLAELYAQAKRAISGCWGIDRAEYVRLKEPVIQEILAHAPPGGAG